MTIVEPRITVAMPVFNSVAYIGQAIDSMLAQTWTDFELLLIDDGSSDETLSVMRSYETDARVRVIALADNYGRPYARNRCLEHARGEYIAMLDADDWSEPDRLARQLTYLDAHPEISVLGSWSLRVDAQGQSLPDSGRREPLTPEAISCEMLFRCPLHNPTVLARTAALRELGYDEHYLQAQDYDLWSRMSETYRMANLPLMLTSYRRHANQATTASDLSVEGYWREIYARQLDGLGVTFTDDDLRCHTLLHRGRRQFRERTGRRMDMAYIRWARTWLETLVSANARCRRYPEPEFARMVGQIWWTLCRKAAREVGAAAWREFARSSLKKAALGARKDQAFAWVARTAKR